MIFLCSAAGYLIEGKKEDVRSELKICKLNGRINIPGEAGEIYEAGTGNNAQTTEWRRRKLV